MSGNIRICQVAADAATIVGAVMRPTLRSLLIQGARGALLAFACAAQAQSSYAPLANLGPVFVDFGNVNIGVRKTVPITVKNLTASTMTFAGGGFDLAGVNAGFDSNSGTCAGSLAAGASCTLNFSFRPRNNLGSVQVGTTVESVSAGGRSQPVSLSFVGRGIGNLVTIRPRAIDFGSWLIGQTAMVPVVVTNRQDVAVSFSGGGFNTSNGFISSTGTCGGGLAAGASCQFNYLFVPGQLGPLQNATSQTVTTAAPEVSQQFPMQVSGTGIGSVGIVAIAPVGIDFGDVKLGSQVTVPMNFTNLDAVTINYAGGGIGVAGPFNSTAVGSPGCISSTAAPGATCSAVFSYRPLTLGEHSTSTNMSFTRPGANQMQNFQLTGTSVGELAQVSPVEFDFGEVAIGTTSTLPVTIFNDGDLALTGFVGGGVTSPFSQSNNCTGSIAPGASCTFTYQFIANQNSVGPRETLT